jgi:hypothetical protein
MCVHDEIAEFGIIDGSVYVSKFAKLGPAHAAGVRKTWSLDIEETYRKCPDDCWLKKKYSPQDLLSDPSPLLDLRGTDATLVFELSSPEPRTFFTTSSSNTWEEVQEIPGDTVHFLWETDGCGEEEPERRWGFAAVVIAASPSGVLSSADDVDSFLEGWAQATARAEGAGTEKVKVSRDQWDEERLMALCRQHGWDFEWMTEDGEWRRRAKEILKQESLEKIRIASSSLGIATGGLEQQSCAQRPDDYQSL